MFRLIFKLDIAGLNTDPCFTTVDSVVESQYTQVMYVCNFHEENEDKIVDI
jgi:hypothetical protein